jgi:hypothetical protein
VLFWNIPNDLVTEAKAHRAQALAGESRVSVVGTTAGNRLTMGKKNIKVGANFLSASF